MNGIITKVAFFIFCASCLTILHLFLKELKKILMNEIGFLKDSLDSGNLKVCLNNNA